MRDPSMRDPSMQVGLAMGLLQLLEGGLRYAVAVLGESASLESLLRLSINHLETGMSILLMTVAQFEFGR